MADEKDDEIAEWKDHYITHQVAKEVQSDAQVFHTDLIARCRQSSDPVVAAACARFEVAAELAKKLGAER